MGRQDESRERDRPASSAFARGFGRAVQVARTESGLSRGDLADETELSRSYLAEIENGTKEP